MPGMGTLADMAMILAGSFVGMLLKKGIPERFKKTIFEALGAAAFLIGQSGVLIGVLKSDGQGGLESQYILLLILSLVIGGAVGEWLRLDRLFDKVGEAMKRRVGKNDSGTDIGAGFVNCTLLFCAGAMSIVGAIQDGLGDPTTLLAKGMLDCVSAILFTAVYGAGVPLSALAVGLYQGGLTLLTFLIRPWLTEAVTLQMSLVGSAVMMLIAFSLWDIKKFNVANLIPAALMPLAFSLLSGLWA